MTDKELANRVHAADSTLTAITSAYQSALVVAEAEYDEAVAAASAAGLNVMDDRHYFGRLSQTVPVRAVNVRVVRAVEL